MQGLRCHFPDMNWLATVTASKLWLSFVSAGFMGERNRGRVSKPLVAPLFQSQQNRIHVSTFVGQSVFVAFRLFLIEHLAKNAMFDKRVESIRKDVSCDTEMLLHVIEAAHAIEAFSQDEKRPPLADQLQ